jgi:long-chain acyl-CoA synthetase
MLHPADMTWIVDDAQARWAFGTRDVAPVPLPGLARQVDIESPAADALPAPAPEHAGATEARR